MAAILHAAGLAWCALAASSHRASTAVIGDRVAISAAWASSEPSTFVATVMQPWEPAPVVVEPEAIQVGQKRFARTSTEVPIGVARVSVPSSAKRPHRSTRNETSQVSSTRRAELTVQQQEQQPQLLRPVLHPPIPSSATLHQSGSRMGTLPKFVFCPPPSYPRIAIERGWQARVLLVITLEIDGRISDVAVETSSGYPLLDGAAVVAVRRWRTQPLTTIGRTEAFKVNLPIEFRLPGRNQ